MRYKIPYNKGCTLLRSRGFLGCFGPQSLGKIHYKDGTWLTWATLIITIQSVPESMSKNTSDILEDAEGLLEVNDVLLLRISFKHKVTLELISSFTRYFGLHRCRWRILATKRVGDNFKMLVTVLAIFVTNIHYLFTLASDTNIPKSSSTLRRQRQDVTNITVTW